jgi:hypothetical protein
VDLYLHSHNKPSWRYLVKHRHNFKLYVLNYEGVSKSFQTESITKYTLTTINTRWEATQRVMAAKPTRLTHKIVIQLHLVAVSCFIFSSRSRLPVRKLLDTPSLVTRILWNLVLTPWQWRSPSTPICAQYNFELILNYCYLLERKVTAWVGAKYFESPNFTVKCFKFMYRVDTFRFTVLMRRKRNSVEVQKLYGIIRGPFEKFVDSPYYSE